MISIIVPAFNTAAFIPDLIASIVGQTVSDWECIVVDDGSTDETYEVVCALAEQDERIRAFSKANGGPSSARNLGFQKSDPSRQFVTFMDSDDVWAPHALELLVKGRLRDSAAIGCHGLAEFIAADGSPILPGQHARTGRSRMAVRGGRLLPQRLDEPTDFSTLISWNVMFPPGLLLADRAVFDRVGPWDESLRGAADWDMLIRLSRHGHFRFIDEVILLYRGHGANLGTSPGEMFRVLSKAFFSPENSPAHRRLAVNGWRGYQRMMIAERLRAAADATRALKAGPASRHLLRAGVSALRFVRGSPRPRVRSEVTTW